MTQPKARWKKNPMGKFCGMKRGVTYMSCLEVRMDQRLGYRWVIYKLYPFISHIYPIFWVGEITHWSQHFRNPGHPYLVWKGWDFWTWICGLEFGIPWDVKITMKIYEISHHLGWSVFFLIFFPSINLKQIQVGGLFLGLIPSFFGALRKDNKPFPSFEELGSI